jgi:hypothetical protein
MKESEMTDRLIKKYGPVNALRLLGWLWKLELEGEAWISERVSRQQLAFIQRQVAEAGVPWEPGTIEWPRSLSVGKRMVHNASAPRAARLGVEKRPSEMGPSQQKSAPARRRLGTIPA